MMEAGIFRTGEGLQPTAKGALIRFDAGRSTVTEGPFPTTIGGFTIIEVPSRDVALDWVSRWPEPDVLLELRQIFEMSDFAVDPAETPDGWLAQEQRFREQSEPA